MRNIVVCCDGTWNTPEETHDGQPTPTNVAKLYNALVSDPSQLVYYHPGVGTGKGWWDRIVGGGAGAGLDDNVMAAYAWLGKTYQPGDRICLFGFSRGAFTARSCAGLLSKYGLLDLSAIDADTAWKRVKALFTVYRTTQTFNNPDGYAFHNAPAGQDAKHTTPIYFIGVWDTVGSLGIPDDFALLGLLDQAKEHQFHDTGLSPIVAIARHAMAIDEKRASFAPTLWTGYPSDQDVQQLWFPGVHSDIGGGYPQSGLSDGSLKWMLGEVVRNGLRVHAGVQEQLRPDSLGILHDSATGIFNFLKSRPRSVPLLDTANPGPELHSSTVDRLRTVPLSQGRYWPTRMLGAGESETFEILARRRWNATGLYLEGGVDYRFDATGEWVDGGDVFPPAGGDTGLSAGTIARFAAGVLGRLEPLYKKLTGERNADFWYTRRYESAPWFALMGFVANDAPAQNPKPQELPVGETFKIGDGCTFTPQRSGYFYAFANDTWQTYDNNRGSVTLTVRRT